MRVRTWLPESKPKEFVVGLNSCKPNNKLARLDALIMGKITSHGNSHSIVDIYAVENDQLVKLARDNLWQDDFNGSTYLIFRRLHHAALISCSLFSQENNSSLNQQP